MLMSMLWNPQVTSLLALFLQGHAFFLDIGKAAFLQGYGLGLNSDIPAIWNVISLAPTGGTDLNIPDLGTFGQNVQLTLYDGAPILCLIVFFIGVFMRLIAAHDEHRVHRANLVMAGALGCLVLFELGQWGINKVHTIFNAGSVTQ